MPVYDVPGVDESDGEVYKVLPPGVYPATIQSCVFKTIEKEGSDYKGTIMLMYTVVATDPASGIEVSAQNSILLPIAAEGYKSPMDGEQRRKALASVKKLQIACGLEDMGTGIDNEAFLYADLQVELGEAKDEGYGMRNPLRDVLPA